MFSKIMEVVAFALILFLVITLIIAFNKPPKFGASHADYLIEESWLPSKKI